MAGPGPDVAGCMACGVPVLMLDCWWAGLGHEVLGPGLVLAISGRSPVLRLVLACWWAGLVPDMVGCEVWDVMELMLACCWLGPDPMADKPEGGFQNGASRHQCPYGRMSSPKRLLPASVSPG